MDTLHSNNESKLQIIWCESFCGEGNDEGNEVKETSDGGYIIVGSSESVMQKDVQTYEEIDDSNILLMKLDKSGNYEWIKTIGGNKDDFGNSILQTSDEGFLIGGNTNSYGNGGFDIWLIKTDSLGNEEWNKTYGGKNNDSANYITETSDEGFLIVGSIDTNVWIIKIDKSFNVEWDRSFTTNTNDKGVEIESTSDGNYIISANRNISDHVLFGDSDIWLIKIDNYGNEVWNHTYGGIVGEFGNSIEETSDGFIIIGTTVTYGISGFDFWLLKIDQDGKELWNKTYGGGLFGSMGNYIIVTPDGYLALGTTYSFSYGIANINLIKTDENGNEQWKNIYGMGETSMSNIVGQSIQQTSDNGYIILGIMGVPEYDNDIIIFKIGHENADEKKDDLWYYNSYLIILIVIIIIILMSVGIKKQYKKR